MPVSPAPDCGGRAELFVTEMAEGELDVDSLISRLLEGESTTIFFTYYLVVAVLVLRGYLGFVPTPVGIKKGPLDLLA